MPMGLSYAQDFPCTAHRGDSSILKLTIEYLHYLLLSILLQLYMKHMKCDTFYLTGISSDKKVIPL